MTDSSKSPRSRNTRSRKTRSRKLLWRQSCWALLVAAVTLPGIAGAGLKDDLEAQWLGAWVVTLAETASTCDGKYTNNEVHGELVQSDAGIRFHPGELAQVAKVDVHRQRVDLLLDLEEPVLVSFRDGPFQLYESRTCKVELKVDVPGRSKDAGLAIVDERFRLVVEQHTRLQDAQASTGWNRRQVAALPEDYEETLAEYRVWKAEQLNQAVQAEIEASVARAADLVARAPSAATWGQGVGSGMAVIDDRLRHVDCSTLMSLTEQNALVRPSRPLAAQLEDGFYFGQRLAFQVLRARLLQSCFTHIGF